MNPDNFGDPLKFPLEPLTGQHLSKDLQNQ